MSGTPLADRVVEVIADLGPTADPRHRYRYGSGCRVAGQTVLTAAHVVKDADTVVIRDLYKEEHAASVEFVGDPNGPDLALLTVDALPPVADALPLAAVDRSSPTGEPVERCRAVGYPRFAERGGAGSVRDTVDTWGDIPVLSQYVEGLLTLQVSSNPRQPPLPSAGESLEGSPWSGMSGAPVLAGEYLVGVVTEHALDAGPSAITVTPLTALDRDAKRSRWGAGVPNAAEWWRRLGAPGGDSRTLMRLPRRQKRTAPRWSVPPVRGDDVARPELAEALVTAVLAPAARTTCLVGAGGFGKTTLARMVAHDPRVRAGFPGGLVWLALGADLAATELASKVVSVARLFDRHAPAVTDPMAARAVLEQALAGRRVLLVVDDVWSTGQVEPFLVGDGNVVRLFTTRERRLLPDDAACVRVDRMTADEAGALLTSGLPALPSELVAAALRVTGRWPVLLSLVHGAVRDAADGGGQVEGELSDVVAELRDRGITALDVSELGERSTAVAATIEMSLRRLTADERQRYAELAVFGEDVDIPGAVVARLWNHTSGWSSFQARRFSRRLYDLGPERCIQPTRSREVAGAGIASDIIKCQLEAAQPDRLLGVFRRSAVGEAAGGVPQRRLRLVQARRRAAGPHRHLGVLRLAGDSSL